MTETASNPVDPGMRLEIGALGRAYRARTLTPAAIIELVYARIAARGEDGVWNHLVPKETALAQAAALGEIPQDAGPLWGIPCAIKDNLDVPGLPTTSGLAVSRYIAETTGPAISRLIAGGAIVIGKTSMDQFALGLVGVRTERPSASCVFNPDFIPGGSSAGSGVAVAAGLVAFSLGNDAAGSGRVPAALNNIVGIKPTPGLISNRAVSGGGVVRSIETISVFALSCADGMTVFREMAGYDDADAFSRPQADTVDLAIAPIPERFAFGVPMAAQRDFHGDADAAALFDAAIARLTAMGGTPVEIDFALLNEAQAILYDGPWIAERTTWLAPKLERYGSQLHPVTRTILESGNQYSARDLFRAQHRLAEIRQYVRRLFREISVLVVPSTPTTFTKAQVEADPIALNSKLGIYTNFVNLLGMCGVAVPNGFRSDGLPQGITFLALELQDAVVASFGDAYLTASGAVTGGPQG
ncbi:allophanate hydrolase [Aquabacter spiritensis]|uniref:Allophanate hydrolase n=1 Tax=Aquabacter spiritensis TaxID=933073 RepID=A0A4R3M1S1_9HYPH|nr:allophanate hydrolase [Aquabacter spiritensis]TCT06673.1 allophanate hydrolase [Aquabacter spiritensis]